MTLSKSWTLTAILYSFSMGVIILEIFTGIVISETQMTMILTMLGISTTAGTSNAIFGNKEAIKKLISELKEGLKN